MQKLLTKSKYMIGLQCPKYLWVIFNVPEKIPNQEKSKQHLFDEGHLIEEYARKLFPSGIEVVKEPFFENIKQSKLFLNKKKPLFEAGFIAENLYSRADILKPVRDKWDIIEIKMSGEVKKEHIQDVAFQKYVYEKAGLKIRKCFLMHINCHYVRKGRIEPKKLFLIKDINDDVEKDIKEIPGRIREMFKIINLKNCPETILKKECKKPYTCPLQEQCWNLPEGNVFELYNARGKEFELYEQGIISLKDIPDYYKLNEKQLIQKKGKLHIDKQNIKNFLSKLKYPVHYLDFETFGSPIPLYNNSRPYQQIPFQYSLHIDNGRKLEHYSFLASGAKDPRKSFLSSLKKNIRKEGSIVVYNQSFESRILSEIADIFPKEKEWVCSLIKRMVDLIVPFRNFYYYNPTQRGSCSIKDVLPALTDRSYSELEITNGGEASLAYINMTFSRIPKEEKEKLRKNLEKYCGLDTEGMFLIVKKLRALSSR
ncbi:MAG: DUF2779 domain-containing protein [Candidatus Woesearchaeota archaeon]